MGTESKDEIADQNDANTRSRHKSKLNRREYIRMGAAAVGLVGMSAAIGERTAADVSDIDFDRVVNAVEDLGMDPTGSEPVDNKFEVEDGTLIEFPPGTYLFTERHDGHEVTNWGIRGTGDSREDVEFVAPEGEVLRILNVRSGRNILVENLTFNQRNTRFGSLGNTIKVQDNLQMRNLNHRGFEPSENTGAIGNLNVLVEDPDGVAVVEDYDMRMGYEHVQYPDNVIGIWSGPTSTGTIYIRRVQMENTPGLYMSRTEGEVRVENCHFRNCDDYAARVCGEGSYLKDCTFVVDVENSNDVVNEHDFNYPVLWESGFQGKTGGYIEGCRFVCRSVAKPVPLIDYDGSAGALEIRDTTFEIKADGVNALRSEPPGEGGRIDGKPDKPWDLTLDGIEVSGASSGVGTTIQIKGRDNSVVRKSCINMDGDRNGFEVYDSDDCEITDTNIKVSGQATVFDNSTVETSNITHTDDCPYHDDSSELPDTLEVKSSTDDVASYTVTVSEDIKGDGTLNSEDTISGTTAEGAVANGADGYNYAGEITEFTYDGQLTVYRNGEQVDSDELGKPDLTETLKIESTTEGTANYSVTVSEDIEGDGTLNDEDSVSGTTAEGAVANGADGYNYAGEITEFTYDGQLTVYRNGEQVDPDALGMDNRAALPNWVVFDGTDADGSDYEFAVTGNIEKSPDLGSVEADDEVSGGEVSGTVDGDKDGYRFSGDISSLQIDGGASVRFEDNDG